MPEGKKKNCQKCGTQLTTNMPHVKLKEVPIGREPVQKREPQQLTISAGELMKQYPEQIGEIVKLNFEQHKKEMTVEKLRELYPRQVDDIIEAETVPVGEVEPEEMTVAEIVNKFPKAVAELTESIEKTTSDKIGKEVKKEIGSLKVEAFAEQFPKLFNHIASAVKRTIKKGKDGNTGPTA